MHTVAVSLLEHFPLLREAGHQLGAFAVRDERCMNGARHVAERVCGHVHRIEGQLLPQNRRRCDAAAFGRTRQLETIELLI